MLRELIKLLRKSKQIVITFNSRVAFLHVDNDRRSLIANRLQWHRWFVDQVLQILDGRSSGVTGLSSLYHQRKVSDTSRIKSSLTLVNHEEIDIDLTRTMNRIIKITDFEYNLLKSNGKEDVLFTAQK